MKEETKSVSFKNNYIILTLFMFLFVGLIVSFFPEKHLGNWLIINSSVAILAAVVNYIIWIFQRHDSKRYFSLHNFVMMVVLIYYAMSPAFGMLYPSKYFWFLLAITVGITILLFVNRVIVARAIHYPKSGFKIFIIIMTIFLISGSFASLIRPVNGIKIPTPVAVAALYLLGLTILSFSPAVLISREKVKELGNLPEEGM